MPKGERTQSKVFIFNHLLNGLMETPYCKKVRARYERARFVSYYLLNKMKDIYTLVCSVEEDGIWYYSEKNGQRITMKRCDEQRGRADFLNIEKLEIGKKTILETKEVPNV